jgi:hypothetical protein
MSETTTPRLINLPADKGIALTPPLWLALGVVSYNHALLAQQPLRVLAPAELTDNLSPERYKALEEGKAAIADTSPLAPSTLIAAVRIAKALLEPLHITVTMLGNEQSRRYLLLEFDPPHNAAEEPPAHQKPRILPTHEYPST